MIRFSTWLECPVYKWSATTGPVETVALNENGTPVVPAGCLSGSSRKTRFSVRRLWFVFVTMLPFNTATPCCPMPEMSE